MTRQATHRHAKAQCRHWYDRYRSLPRWRWKARREAKEKARIWGVIAKYSHDETV